MSVGLSQKNTKQVTDILAGENSTIHIIEHDKLLFSNLEIPTTGYSHIRFRGKKIIFKLSKPVSTIDYFVLFSNGDIGAIDFHSVHRSEFYVFT